MFQAESKVFVINMFVAGIHEAKSTTIRMLFCDGNNNAIKIDVFLKYKFKLKESYYYK